MGVGSGLGSFIRVKKEGTPGTKATGPYLQIPFTSESMNKVGRRASANNITSNRFRARTFLTGYDVGGTINGAITYENIDWLLLGALGTVATAASSTPFTNIYTPTTFAPTTFPSFTVEVSKGDVPTGKVFYWTGARVSNLTLNFSASGESTYSADLVAFDELSTTTTGDDPVATPTTLTDICILPNEATTMDIGVNPLVGSYYCVRSAQIQIATPYANDRPCLGTYTAKMPLPSGVGTVSGNAIIEFADRAVYDAFKADTVQSTIQLTYTGPIFTGATAYALNCFVNQAYYVKALGNIDGPGPVLAEVGWEAEGTAGSSTTSQPIAFSTVNSINGDTVL